MKLLKVFILAVLFISVYSESFSQDFYFTYNPPSSITIPYGANSVDATYTFNYYWNEGMILIRPKLSIQLDGTTIAGAICEGGDSYLPSSYTLNLTSGTHTIKLTLSDLGQQSNSCTQANIWQITTITVTPKFTLRNENIFTTGTIYVDNYDVSKNSPYDRPSNVTNNYAIGAINQNAVGYDWVWNNSGINNSKWQKQLYNNPNMSDLSYDRNTAYNVQSNDNSTKLIAGLRKICNVNFQNSFVGVGNGGVIKVNNTQYNSPTAQFNVVELNPIAAAPVSQTINNIIYRFSQWSDGNTTESRTFNPSSTITYTVQYIGKASITNRNLHFNASDPNQPITVIWNEHPNANVTQYQIWRKTKYKKGATSSPVLIGTVNRGTTTFVDYDYAGTNLGFTDWRIFYDVKFYYSIEGTLSDDDYVQVFSDGPLAKKTDDNNKNITESVLENKIDNYPNPFNPGTIIKFSLKESGFVSLKVFDLVGQQVAELVNEEKEAGSYSVSFDASWLPSGVYIYTIHSGSFVQTRKMLLMK